MTAILRTARPEDAPAIGEVHVASWRETYPGMLPEERLAELDPVERGQLWAKTIDGGPYVSVVEDTSGIVGFSMFGPQRERWLGCEGEFWAIYLLRRAQRQGLGRAMMVDMARNLISLGHGSAALWVVSANLPAIRFYERLGGRVLAIRPTDSMGRPVPETAYGWDRLETLL